MTNGIELPSLWQTGVEENPVLLPDCAPRSKKAILIESSFPHFPRLSDDYIWCGNIHLDSDLFDDKGKIIIDYLFPQVEKNL